MRASLAPCLTALLTLAISQSPSSGTEKPSLRSQGSDTSVTDVGGKTLHQWMDDLKSPDASIREEAIRAITLFGSDASRAVPLIVERLQDSDSSPRVRAATALGTIEIRKEDRPAVIRALGRRLEEDSQAIVRYQAALALSRFGEEASLAQNGLIRGANDRSTWEIRHACIVDLKQAGRDPQGGPNTGAERALIQALHDSTSQVRLEAVLTLGALGRPKDNNLLLNVVQDLKDRLSDHKPIVRIWAHVALMALGDVTDKSVQTVIKYLKDNDATVRMQAARALGTMGDKAKAAVPALNSALHDKEAPVVTAAGWALMQMGELSGPGKADLLDLLKNPDPAVRAAVAQSLGSVGIKARSAVSALVELAQDRDQPPFVVGAACWALGEIGESTPAVIEALKSISQRKGADESLKRMAQTALDQIRKLK